MYGYITEDLILNFKAGSGNSLLAAMAKGKSLKSF